MGHSFDDDADLGGYFKVWRKAKGHFLWQLKPFDHWHAWEYLFAFARWGDGAVKVGRRTFDLRRGQLLAGKRELAREWGWGWDKVNRFLMFLAGPAEMIEMSGQRPIVITICNYRTYQGGGKEGGVPPGILPGVDNRENDGFNQDPTKITEWTPEGPVQAPEANGQFGSGVPLSSDFNVGGGVPPGAFPGVDAAGNSGSLKKFKEGGEENPPFSASPSGPGKDGRDGGDLRSTFAKILMERLEDAKVIGSERTKWNYIRGWMSLRVPFEQVEDILGKLPADGYTCQDIDDLYFKPLRRPKKRRQ